MLLNLHFESVNSNQTLLNVFANFYRLHVHLNRMHLLTKILLYIFIRTGVKSAVVHMLAIAMEEFQHAGAVAFLIGVITMNDVQLWIDVMLQVNSMQHCVLCSLLFSRLFFFISLTKTGCFLTHFETFLFAKSDFTTGLESPK